MFKNDCEVWTNLVYSDELMASNSYGPLTNFFCLCNVQFCTSVLYSFLNKSISFVTIATDDENLLFCC